MTDPPGSGGGAAHSAGNGNGAGSPDAGYAELRHLLVGPEEEQLRLLQQRLDDPVIHAQDVSRIVAEAVELRHGRGADLRRAMRPVIEDAIRASVQRDPSILSDALFPIIGSAIRKAVSKALRGMIETLNQTLEQSFSLRGLQWRVEALRTGRSFGEILLLRSQLYHVEQVFLIHKQTGLLLQHLSRRDAVVRDADLVSGMLTAIQDFVHDSFGSAASEDLEVMQVGEFNIWIQHGSRSTLACLVRGVPPRELKVILQLTLTGIEDRFWREMDAFDGDAGPLAGAQPMLESCLLGKLGDQPPGRHAGRWILAAAACGALAAAVIWAGYKQVQRNAYIQRLSAEPGIVVTSRQTHWGVLEIAGLRDPLATDPASLLSGSGIAPGNVRFHWEPFQSLEPRFFAIRRFQALKEAVEAQPVFFELASSHVNGEILRPIARNLLALSQAATVIGKRFQVEIEGRTDPPGPAAQNVRLAGERASAVFSELVRQGVPAQRLAVQTVPAPSAAGPGTANAWDRRVSFRVVEP